MDIVDSCLLHQVFGQLSVIRLVKAISKYGIHMGIVCMYELFGQLLHIV